MTPASFVDFYVLIRSEFCLTPTQQLYGCINAKTS